MAQLYYHPFCPHSRFIRIVMAEYGMEPEMIEERTFERRQCLSSFVDMVLNHEPIRFEFLALPLSYIYGLLNECIFHAHS